MTDTVKPSALEVCADAIPAELTALSRWVMWRYEYRQGDGKWTKVPHQPSGQRASSTNPATWSTFSAVIAAYRAGGWDGIGMVLCPDDDLVGIDLDHVGEDIDQALVDKILVSIGSYAERSPSGAGVRAFVRAKLPAGSRKRGPFEVYETARYLTVTGHHLEGTPRSVEHRQEEVEAFCRRFLPPPKPAASLPPASSSTTLSDHEVLERAFAAANGAKVRRLYDGGDEDHDGDRSAGDLAVCSALGFWTQDPAQLDRLFRGSGRHRHKWDERHFADGGTYGERTIRKALDGLTETWTPSVERKVDDDPGPGDVEAEAALAELATGAVPLSAPVEAGWNVLDVVGHFLARFVVFPSSAARDAAALWVVHTHALAAADSTPRLALLSAEKRSGKSRLLELLELLVARPMMTASISAAALFRQVEAVTPTLLMDEADTYFGKAKDDHEDLRGMLNAGHRRGAMAYRCAGPKMAEVKAYSAFAAVALAGIGDLPSTIADRAITVRMKRRRPDEKVERFRRRKVTPEAERLVTRVEAWVTANIDALTVAEPKLPEALDDRAADGWEPLLAIADKAAGDWPERARRAALELSADKAPEDDTAGVRLLADCRAVFDGAERLSSADLAAKLAALEEAPWSEWKKGPPRAPIDATGLARMLRGYGVRPKQLRIGEEKVRGYECADLEDAWGRYLSPGAPEPPSTSSDPVHPVHRRSEPLFDPVQAEDVYRPHTPSDQPCTGVPGRNGETGASGLCDWCGTSTWHRSQDGAWRHESCEPRP